MVTMAAPQTPSYTPPSASPWGSMPRSHLRTYSYWWMNPTTCLHYALHTLFHLSLPSLSIAGLASLVTKFLLPSVRFPAMQEITCPNMAHTLFLVTPDNTFSPYGTYFVWSSCLGPHTPIHLFLRHTPVPDPHWKSMYLLTSNCSQLYLLLHPYPKNDDGPHVHQPMLLSNLVDHIGCSHLLMHQPPPPLF